MNTPAHLIFGLAAFGRPGAKAVTAAALAGALVPDLSLYILAGTHLFVLGTEPQVVFGEMYFSDAWQSIFRIDNSILLWGVGLALALWAGSAAIVALAGSGLMHLVLDLALHHDDGRAHFWPVTDWIFRSPVSYWDTAHYGGLVGPLEIGIALALCIWLWRRYSGWPMRGLIVLLAVAEALPAVAWAVML